MKILLNYSPNFSKKLRKIKDIKFIVFHYTGMQSEIESIKRLTNEKTKVSCHYLINRKGLIIQMVKDKNIAWHAGKSKWKNFINLNKLSLGIELVNKGHQFGYQNYTKKQINSLISLCKKLKKKYRIKDENFLGHSDIAPLRKADPGEKFPWKKLSKFKFGKWYHHKDFIAEKDKKKIEKIFFQNIKKLGYRYFNVQRRSNKDKKIIKSFQQHYTPNNVTSKIDQKTYIISQYLTN